MKIKLIKYIEDNINLFDDNTIICYVDNKAKPSFIEYSIFLDSDTKIIVLHYNSLTRIDYYDTLNHELCTSYYSDVEIETDKIRIFSFNQWIKFRKEIIKKSVSLESFHHKDLYNICRNNGGKLIRHNDKLGMFIGVSSTDEDYYYVLVNNTNNKIKFQFITCCHRLEGFIDSDHYGAEERDLLAFISKNKNEIVTKVNNFEGDVMISGVNFGKTKPHHRHYRVNALDETFKHCNTFFNGSSKCVEDLKGILKKLNDVKVNSNVVQLLNSYITEYGLYYKPLNKHLKNYYRDTFVTKLKNIFDTHTKKIDNEKVVSYLNNICKTMNKTFFK